MRTPAKFLMAAALVMFAACTNELQDNQVQPVEGEEIVLSAVVDNGVGTKVTLTDDNSSKVTVAWKSSGEAFTALVNGTAVAFSQTTGNLFRGTIPTGTAADAAVYAIYPSASMTSASAISLDLSSQTGAGLEENNTLMYAKGKVSDESLTFYQLASIMKVQMTFPGGVSGNAEDVTLVGDDLIYKAKVDLTGAAPEFSEKESGAIGLSGSYPVSSLKASAYVYILPGTSSEAITVSAVVGGNLYEGTIPARSKAIEAGKVYTANVTLTKKTQTKYYVTTTGTAANSGISWSKATTLTNALANVPAGGEIHIAAGTYKPEDYLPYVDCKNDEASKGFHINKNVTIQGGYPADPKGGYCIDYAANKTILSGNNTSYHVVYISAPTEEGKKVVLNGIIVTEGHGAGADGSYKMVNVDLINAAGTLKNFGGQPANHGAGILAVTTSTIEMTDVTITGNDGQKAAGMYCCNANAKLTNCTISSNTAVTAASGILFEAKNGYKISAEMNNCTIDSNTTATTGQNNNSGCIYIYGNGGGIATYTADNCTFTNNTIGDTAKSGTYGGSAAYIQYATAAFKSCTFRNNSTKQGTVFIYHASDNTNTKDSDVSFDKCIFDGNSSTANGSAISLQMTKTNQGGGSSLHITNSVFKNNTGGDRVVHINQRCTTAAATIQAINSTFSGNSSGQSVFGLNGSSTALINTDIISSTITANKHTADNKHASLLVETVGVTTNVYNSIISGNLYNETAADASVNGTTAVINSYGSFIGHQHYTADGDGVTGTASTFNPATMLGALEQVELVGQVGSTWVHKLTGENNPAKTGGMSVSDMVDLSGLDQATLEVDQRGGSRTGTVAGACVL